jgi:hypothetical protein
MLTDDQAALLCEIGQSIAFSDDRRGEVEDLIIEGYVAKDGDLYELTPKGLMVIEERAASLAALSQPDTPAAR